MGLHFSHGQAQWKYSGFSRFREKLAKEIGILLEDMEGFGGEKSWDTVEDAIKPLLDHSDCEGDLSPEECAMVAPRLRELVSDWDDEDWDKENAIYLAEGMELCAKQKVPLEFR